MAKMFVSSETDTKERVGQQTPPAAQLVALAGRELAAVRHHGSPRLSPESAFCNTQVAEAPCTTFNSLVPALLQSGTGAPRCDLPLYSLPIRLTVVKIRPVTSPYRRLPRYTTCAPPTLIPCERILPSPPYSHSLFPSGKH